MDGYRNSENFTKSKQLMLKCTLLLLLLVVVVVVLVLILLLLPVVVVDNEKLNDLYSSPNIVRVRWVGHVALMGRREVYTGFWWWKKT